MKKKFRLLCLILLFSLSAHSQQVGINTATPTKTLDINGSVRIRSTSDKSSDTNYDKVIVTDINGNVDHVTKSSLNQKYVQLFNLSTIPSVLNNSNTVPSTITTQTITLVKTALVTINFSVPVILSAAATDGRAKILRTHLLVNDNPVVRATNIYTNTPSTGTNVTGIFYNSGSYSIELPAGTHTISLQGFCFDNVPCTQGGNSAGTNFQAYAIYNDY